MNAERDEVTELLRGVEQASGASAEERARAEERMWAAFDDFEPGELDVDHTSGSSATQQGRSELVRLVQAQSPSTPAPRRRFVWRALAAAAAVIVVVVGVALIGRDNQPNDVAEQPEPTAPLVTLDTIAGTIPDAVEIQRTGLLPAGAYRLDVGEVAAVFELDDEFIVVDLQPDRVVFAPTGGTVRGTANLVTVFFGRPLVDADGREAWLAERSETTQRFARAMDGTRVDEFLISVSAEACTSFEDCVEVATRAVGDPLALMAAGVNRLVVDDLDDGSALFVLGTFESSIRDRTLDLYSDLLASFTYVDPPP